MRSILERAELLITFLVFYGSHLFLLCSDYFLNFFLYRVRLKIRILVRGQGMHKF